MHQAARNGAMIGVAVVACLVVAAAGVLYRNLEVLYENSSWVAHTHAVMAAVESLHATVIAAESGQRGYLITGDDEYLVPCRAAIDRWADEADQLRALVVDNVPQRDRLEALNTAIAARMTEIERIVDIRRDQGFDAARAALMEHRGLTFMTEIRTKIDEILRAEEELLADRQRANAAAYGSARLNATLAALAALVALTALAYLIRRYAQLIESSAAAIHQDRELLRAMLSSIGDGVIATDRQGHVTLINAVAEKLTGWQSAAAIGQPLDTVFRIIDENSRQLAPNPAERALHEGRIVGLANHTVLIARDGTEWPLDDSAAPIRNGQGAITGAILVFREISDRKRQEDLLRQQATALAEANQRKDEFLATLAHELRNPLSPISNALQLWPFVEDNRVELERLRNLMSRQVRRMTRLIDDLLDVSRITRGKIQIYKQTIDIVKIIKEAVELVTPDVNANRQELSVALPSAPLLVEGDADRLMQVFGNILNNAVKYTPRGGQISLTIASEAGRVVVRVRDNGAGIPPAMLNEVFEMFRQADTSLERAHGGLGIGLTLVKRLVEQHDGTVEARSEGVGQGSEFIVTFPLLAHGIDAPPADERSRRPDPVPPLRRHRVLVVDDVKASAQTLAMMLSAIGQEVAQAHDGGTAIEWTLAHDPDVVFLDIAMPGMSGYDVARRLRAERKELVLVALTGFGQDEDRRQSIEAGFDHHIVKPTSIEVLRRLLGTVGSRDGDADDAD